MNFQVGPWLHTAPEKEYGADGRRAVLRRLCFGSAEAQVWYESRDGRYYREHLIAEGIQAGERYIDPVGAPEFLAVINEEIKLCEKYGRPELTELFCIERDRIAKTFPSSTPRSPDSH